MSRPVNPHPGPRVADPSPGFSRMFPNIEAFLAFAKAEAGTFITAPVLPSRGKWGVKGL